MEDEPNVSLAYPGEVTMMSADDARQLTNEIKLSHSRLWELVVKAYQQRAWAAIGYDSWSEYCRREFHRVPLRRVSPDERAEIITGLRESGMSYRAIASAVGTGTRQVQELCSETTVETVTGEDGKNRPAKRTTRKSKRDALLAEPMRMKDQAHQSDTPTGSTDEDGEQSASRNPSPQPKRDYPLVRRGPITDAFAEATSNLMAYASTLQGLTADDRFKRNAQAIANRNKFLLRDCMDMLDAIYHDQLPEPEGP